MSRTVGWRALLTGLVVLVGQVAGAAEAAALAPPPEPPEVIARAAVVVEASTGEILYQKYAFERLPPASLTKMATAMVALERADPATPIVASANSLVEPAVIGLDPGDRLPLTEALYGLMLNSGNDAALAIAETLGDGSVQQFVGWMNRFAESLGLLDTRFANPHGLDIGEHYSSAYDMSVIARATMRQPLLRAIVGEQRHVYQGPPVWAFRNSNPFLSAYVGADGIKTGFEDRAGRCLAASATRDGRRVIAIVLNSARYVAESGLLIDYGFAKLAWKELSGQSARRILATSLMGRTLADAGAAAGRPRERAYLRGMARGELGRSSHGSSWDSRGGSAYERLSRARNGQAGSRSEPE